MATLYRINLFLTVLSLCSQFAFAADVQPLGKVTVEEQKQIAKLFADMKYERSKLVSGVYRASGHLRWRGAGETEILEGPVERFRAFDKSLGLLRYECTEPSRDFVGGEPDDQGHIETEKIIRTVQYIRTPEFSAINTPSFLPGDSSGTVYTYAPGEPLPTSVRPIVIEALGLVVSAYMYGELRDNTWDYMVDMANVSFERTEGKVILTKSFVNPSGNAEFRFQYTIDVDKGLTPVHRASWSRNPGESDWGKPVSEVSITWEEVDDVWIPSSVSFDEPGADHALIDEYRLSFQWLSVNTPVDESLFELESFNKGAGTHVYDQRLGEQILKEIVSQETRPKKVPLKENSNNNNKSRPMWWLIIANVLAVVVIAIVVLLRRR